MLLFSFGECFTRLQCYFLKDPLKRVLLDIYLTTFSGVRKLKNTWARILIFVWKCGKLNLNLENKKKRKKFFSFWDKCIWKCCNKLPLLRRQLLSSAVNELKNSPKILHIIKRYFFNPNCVHRINKYGKGAFVQLWTTFWPVYNVSC